MPILKENDPLSKAVEVMASTDQEFLPVTASDGSTNIIGVITYKDILHAYRLYHQENQESGVNLSLRRQRKKMIIRGRQFVDRNKSND